MKEFVCNQAYHGFLLEKTVEIADIHSTAFLFRHEQSGARLIYLKNKDHNKVFNVALKTPPQDDCGTPHILEHSVLCGSRKYEAKDPFNELAKGSLNTFLNAMTYADKTMYPVASCNEKDFHNLMDVYLDAVFFPRIYEKKEIFQQEGWRYTLQEEQLGITGVVYNEMKGALSDPESLLSGVISKAVFGDTTYGFESGGAPDSIPKLTYKAFLDFHKMYYHPSNAYFFLYGDMDADSCLSHIAEYLVTFEKSDALPMIQEVPFAQKGQCIRKTYPIGEDAEEGGSYFSYSVKAGKCTDPERIMAMQILSYVLLESNASPLKNILIEKGICQEAEGWFDSSTYEMVFSIVAKNAVADKIEEFIKTIQEECCRLAEKGLPSDLLQGALRKYDFLLREEDYGSTPKGLVYCTRLMKSWLHGEDPCNALRHLEVLEKLKGCYQKGYFEELLKTLFCENEESVAVIFEPEKGKAEKDQEAWKKEMQTLYASISSEELRQMKTDAENLDRFQKQEDTPEILSQIPLLELDEIDEMPQLIQYHSISHEVPFLHVPMESNGILYLKLLFRMDGIPQELIPYTGLLTELIGKLDTKNYSYQALPNALDQIFGGFSLHHDTYNKNAEEYHSFVSVKTKLLHEDLQRAVEMLNEVLFHTDFDMVENLKKIIRSAKIKGEQALLNNSHYYGIFYSGANLFKGLYIDELTSGIRYYRFLCEIDKKLAQSGEDIIARLKEAAQILFTRENMEIALGCEEKYVKDVQKKLILPNLPHGKHIPLKPNFSMQPEKIAFTTATGIVYNITSIDIGKQRPYCGSLKVLQTIINREYLWNQLRIQGGAYGGGSKFLPSGFAYFYSYRDPNLKESYGVYKKLATDIANFEGNSREMTKYILGTINELDQPKTNMEKLNIAIGRFYRGTSDESLIRERKEILQTTDADIRSFSELLKQIDCENICTIGSEQKIRENAEAFTKIETLI